YAGGRSAEPARDGEGVYGEGSRNPSRPSHAGQRPLYGRGARQRIVGAILLAGAPLLAWTADDYRSRIREGSVESDRQYRPPGDAAIAFERGASSARLARSAADCNQR